MFVFKDNYPLDLIDDSEENTSFENRQRKTWTKKEGKQYFKWYVETMYDRIKTMGELMKIDLNFTLESLDILEDLFYQNFGTHTYSDGQTTASAEISSFCGDIARYMTVFTLANRPDLTLMLQPSNSTRLDTYMYPVIKGYNVINKNYVLSIDREISTFAYAYYEGLKINEKYFFKLKNRLGDYLLIDKSPYLEGLIYDSKDFNFDILRNAFKITKVKLENIDISAQIKF